MHRLKKYPYFLFLLVFFFCLHGSVENFGLITVKEVATSGLWMLMGIVFLFGLVFLITRKLLFAALVVFFSATCFFFFGAFHDFIKSISIFSVIKSYRYFVPIMLSLLALLILFLRKKINILPKITLYLNVLLIIYCFVDLVSVLLLTFQPTEKNKQEFNFQYLDVTQKPDVYFLLFDSYPGQKSLTDSFNFNNEKFNNFLLENSFKPLNTRSNYNATFFSMASMLNMRYIDKKYTWNIPTPKEENERQSEIKNASVFTLFKNMGYDIYNYSIFDLENNRSSYTQNNFLNNHSRSLNDKVFINRVIRDLAPSMPPDMMALFPNYYDYLVYGNKFDNINLEKDIYSFLERKRVKPSFLYAHFLMPHAPYFYDSLGNDISKKILLSSEMNPDTKLFLSYLKYTNQVISRIILAIKKKNPDSIIIFMSDHGCNIWNISGNFEQSFYNNCAVYFPNKIYGETKNCITNVNFFPYLFNTQYNQKLEYLPDSLFPIFMPF